MLPRLRRSASSQRDRRQEAFALRAATGLAVAGLVLFHALLLWYRITSWSLLKPDVILRWGAAMVLLFAVLRLRRSGVSLLWSRPALVFWLLVALLHAGAVPALEARPVDPSASLALAFTLSSVYLASLGGLAALTGSRAFRGLPGSSILRRPPAHLAFRVCPFAPLCPRPPPV